jgi:hypothetical protein
VIVSIVFAIDIRFIAFYFFCSLSLFQQVTNFFFFLPLSLSAQFAVPR